MVTHCYSVTPLAPVGVTTACIISGLGIYNIISALFMTRFQEDGLYIREDGIYKLKRGVVQLTLGLYSCNEIVSNGYVCTILEETKYPKENENLRLFRRDVLKIDE